MWRTSASFVLDKQQEETKHLPSPYSTMAETLQNPNPNPNPNISAYYQTRAAHHGVITSDWLAQAQAAVGRDPTEFPSEKGVRSMDSGKSFSVIDEFNHWRKQPDLAEAVAAILALASVIRSSEATTMMELEIELKKASDSLKVASPIESFSSTGKVEVASDSVDSGLEEGWSLLGTCSEEVEANAEYDSALKEAIRRVQDAVVSINEHLEESWDTTSISLTAGCDLFMRYVTRTSALEYEDFNAARSRLIERGEKFGEISRKARRTIAMLSQDFILDGCTILVHGFSRVVLEVLKTAAQNKKLFRVLCTEHAEGRPDRTGLRLSNELAKLDVPVKLLIDSAVAYTMEEVDMVFVGADGVVESGGIINMMGTYQIALVAHSMNKPVYVAAESYKFARLYPLDQKDMVPALRPIDFGVPIPSGVEVETSARDYTPPQYLTLLFTDLGVLTPSVVSDELIQLYL
ncbi:hypothetical protein HHK36_014467 [Tetracentron sinense]|uniref:Translation initiation factor eIF2B subunit alpha n=1 Tax=Tetracentron sinense TaxID=13715 RepID=A0A835DE99_TETSI|nr:hypothetical protein HHK36_014467 [Tetracentron sinense]